MNRDEGQRGFALVTVMMLLALLLSLLVAYFTLTRIEMSATSSTMGSVRGLYAAEAGLNLRAEVVRQVFQGYNRPMGAGPDDANNPCTGFNLGNGDLACVQYALQRRVVTTYLQEDAANPTAIVVPRGEPFQNLNAQEYRYEVVSVAESAESRSEALLELQFKSRLIPMFQFAVFYNKDLEILPGPTMTLAGPVHTNGDLYLGSQNELSILGQVTTVGDLFHGRKNDDTCMGGGVSVLDPAVLTGLPACAGGTTHLTQPDVDPWNGMIRTGVDVLTVPPPEALNPTPGEVYWDKADIRVMLDLNGAIPVVQMRNPDGTVNVAGSAALGGCGAAAHGDTFFNNREGLDIDMLDVDIEVLLDCIHANGLLGIGKGLDDSSEGGLVFYLGVDGPASAGLNNYGVRVANGAELASSALLAPDIQGLTVVSNQAMYVQGDYNAVNKKPAAFLADSLNILSNAWDDANSADVLDNRLAVSTTIQAAFLAGTDTTGGIEGAAGQFLGQYNGGVENYPRFHEKWSGRTLTYNGSFVSLNNPQHVDGGWSYGAPQYTAPIRDWYYDTDFNSAENLPPLSPRFVHLKQELFIRQFEL